MIFGLIPRDLYSLVFGAGLYAILVKIFVWSLPNKDEEESSEECSDESSDESSDSCEDESRSEHPIYLLIKRLLQADGIDQERLSDERIREMCDKYVEEFDKVIEETDETFQQVEQYLMKIKPLVVSIINELKEPEVEVESVSNALPLASKPVEGTVRYEKLDDLAAPANTPMEAKKDFSHIVGKRYVDALEEVAKDGYTMKIAIIGDNFKWESSSLPENVIPVWIEDKEFDYYTGRPSELAVVKSIAW